MMLKMRIVLVSFIVAISSNLAAAPKRASEAANPVVAYWNFDEIVDSKLKDQSGNGHEGNVTGATVGEGKLGSALLFTAANKNFISVPNSEQFNFPNKQYTVMAWVKPRKLDPQRASGVLNYSMGYGLRISSSGRLTYADSMMWDFCAFGAYGKLEQDKWQHLAAVRNGDKVFLYIDGKEVGSRSVPGDTKPSKSDIVIGAHSSTADYFDGWIDEVAIFGKALTPKAIQVKAQQGAAK